jgi:hypothetical protein
MHGVHLVTNNNRTSLLSSHLITSNVKENVIIPPDNNITAIVQPKNNINFFIQPDEHRVIVRSDDNVNVFIQPNDNTKFEGRFYHQADKNI